MDKKILFKFEANGTVSKKIINDVTRYFSRGGAQVISHDVAKTTTKRAGIEFRSVTFTFADSQTVTLNVKTTGDIFEAKVNGSVVPLHEQDNHEGTIKELAAQMTKRRAAFQKSLNKVKTPVPKGIRQTRPQRMTAKTQQRDDLKEKVTEAKQELAELTGTTADAI